MNPLTPRHGGQLAAIADRFGIPAVRLMDLSASINPDGPPASVLRALAMGIGDAETLTRYPELEEPRLKAALARYAGAREESLLVANGFAPLLDAVLRTLKIRECLVPVPAFNEYRRVLEQNGIGITPMLLRAENHFRYDVDALLAGSHDAILLANPQNPSGALATKTAMLHLVENAAKRGTFVLLDEAFIDYAMEESLASEVERCANLVVFRSVTKCFGVPGLRVAYAIAPAPLRRRVEDYLHPWAISTLASLAIIAAVEDVGLATTFPAVNRRRRSELAEELKALGLEVYPAAANFLLFRLPPGWDAISLWEQMITKHNIVLRSCENFEVMPPGHLRTLVGRESSNGALVRALAMLLGHAGGGAQREDV